ncbi:MAG TPA: uracil-DNA glycosylase family protein [Rhodospirillaceae bacterium]|nr:uracil-DNA glycosylase family protein [Rhodospirillaceae bacterium]
MTGLAALLAEIRACRLCEAHLPLGPRPTLAAAASARVLVAGQAPGRKVHDSGIPWNDRSGDRLRQWMGLERGDFYDEGRLALIPTGFCYPGADPKGGDLPPRRECAPTWHPRLLAALPGLRLTLLVGSYAQAFHLGSRRKSTMTETVRSFRDYLPDILPLPHPSWRTTAWETKNPWFGDDVLPELRRQVRALL